MKRALYFTYGLFCYLVFLGVYTYFIFWENNTLVSTGIDLGTTANYPLAMALNTLLIALFFVPHSVMARKEFKEKWTRIIPKTLERSTYVLISSLLLGTLILLWQPIPLEIYKLDGSWVGTALMALSFAGFGMTVFCTFLINHFDLFGLKQVFYSLIKQEEKPSRFVNPLFYKLVRHPLYFSFLIAFWCNSVFTVGHFLFSGLATIYTFVGISFEEKDLRELFGRAYSDYSKRTPKLFPSILKSRVFLFITGLATICLAIGYFLGPVN